MAYKTKLVVYMYKIKGLASISNPHVFQAKMPFLFSRLTATLFSGLTATPFFILEESHPSCVGLVCCMSWNGVLYVLDWCVVCTGLVCCMYWTGHTSPIHQPSTYTSPVQHTSPVHNTLLHVLNWERGLGHCPCTFVKEEGWW